MLKDCLLSIQNDLAKHKCTDKNKLMSKYVENRLNNSLKNYYTELMNSYSYVSRHELTDKELRKINKCNE